MGILYYTKLKSSLEYKVILDFAIPYLIAMIITSFEFSKNLKKNQNNLLLEHHLVTFDLIIIEVWNK